MSCQPRYPNLGENNCVVLGIQDPKKTSCSPDLSPMITNNKATHLQSTFITDAVVLWAARHKPHSAGGPKSTAVISLLRVYNKSGAPNTSAGLDSASGTSSMCPYALPTAHTEACVYLPAEQLLFSQGRKHGVGVKVVYQQR